MTLSYRGKPYYVILRRAHAAVGQRTGTAAHRILRRADAAAGQGSFAVPRRGAGHALSRCRQYCRCGQDPLYRRAAPAGRLSRPLARRAASAGSESKGGIVRAELAE
jgi:hypothetical protein